jgi:hypothetical protein
MYCHQRISTTEAREGLMGRVRSCILFPILLLLVSTILHAQIPRRLSYQGLLTDSSGTPKPDGLYTLTFRLYGMETGGSVLWTESKPLTVERGLFATILGDTNPFGIALLFDRPYWLSVQVEDQAPLVPRVPLTASAYSLGALRADTALYVRSGAGPASGTADSARVAGTAAALRVPSTSTGTDTGYALAVHNTGAGDGIRAFSEATEPDYGALYAANSAQSGEGAAVVARSLKGRGVFTMGDELAGVDAQSISGIGVYGASADNFGVVADGNDEDFTDLYADLFLAGELGEIMSDGTVDILSATDVYVDLNNNDGTTASYFAVFNGVDDAVFYVDEMGDIAATGSKSAMVRTATSGDRLLYATESPEVWFEDFGTGSLSAGTAEVLLEKVFLQTINTTVPYHVFLTPIGDEPVILTVTRRGTDGFAVRGTTLDGKAAACDFDYRIVARRIGYENVRLAQVNPAYRTKRAAGAVAARPKLKKLQASKPGLR